MIPTVALSIAGSDSSAGAGIQADLKTFAALGVYGATVVTAITAQSTKEVTAVIAMSPVAVDQQITAVIDDLSVRATKTGMLPTAYVARAVANRAAAGELPNLVVDPVMIATSGDELTEKDTIAVYRERLIPHALIVTPNLYEAAVLAGMDEIADLDSMVEAARRIASLGCGTVVVKGGHLLGSDRSRKEKGRVASREQILQARDVVLHLGEVSIVTSAAVATNNTHGTGCTYSAAIAAGLARGLGVLDSIGQAKRYVHAAICGSADWVLGSGHGPLDHFGWGPANPPN